MAPDRSSGYCEAFVEQRTVGPQEV